MKPTRFDGAFAILGVNQPEYIPLSVHRDREGVVTSCWQLSLWERIKILFKGKLYLQQLCFDKCLQPQKLSIDKPELGPQ